MTINNIKLTILCLILILVQFLINNLTILYVDLLTIVPLVLLLDNRYNWIQLIVLSLLCDLIGHWYFGSHLLAITILSIFSVRLVNFYKICNAFQKLVINGFFLTLLLAIIYVISLATARVYISWYGFLANIFVGLPLIQLLISRFVFPRNSEYIFYG